MCPARKSLVHRWSVIVLGHSLQPEIRNPKSEIRNKDQKREIRMFQTESSGASGSGTRTRWNGFRTLQHSRFEFVSDFVLRISDLDRGKPWNRTSVIGFHGLRAILCCVVLWLGAFRLLAAEPDVRVEPRERWSAVFGESEVKFTFEIASPAAFTGRVNWSLSAKKRTIARGEERLEFTPDQPASVTVPLRIPPVKEGLIFETELTVAVHGSEGGQPKGTLVKPIWVYPQDPFADRTRWLKERKLVLYDPAGKTAEVFDKAKIPYRELRNIAGLAAVEEGLVVIGEGVSLADHRDLAETVSRLAADGVPVLCLAPAEGAFELPGSGEAERDRAGAGRDEQPEPRRSARPESLSFRRQDVLTDLDHRLDAHGWPPDGKLVAHSLALTSERGRVVAQVADSADGWSWLQVRYPRPAATLVICQFTLIEHWDAGPTPRFLLARLFEYLASEPASPAQEKDVRP
jgi:hypothetical protein